MRDTNVSEQAEREREEGKTADFALGFLLGFLFSFIFMIVVLLCRMNKMIKIGVLCGVLSNAMFRLAYVM